MNSQNLIKIINRNDIEITGVKDICSYDSEKIVIALEDTEMILTGKNFNVKKLDTDNCTALVNGFVHSLIYNDRTLERNKTFLASLFK